MDRLLGVFILFGIPSNNRQTKEYQKPVSRLLTHLKDVYQLCSCFWSQLESLGGLTHGATMGAEGRGVSEHRPAEAHGC